MSTTRVTLPAGIYTDLGTTPCSIQIESGAPIQLVVQSTGLPAANAASMIISERNMRSTDIGYASQNAYAKPLGSNALTVIVIR